MWTPLTPIFLSCPDSQCLEYDPDTAPQNTEMEVCMKLCDLHKQSLLAPNPGPPPSSPTIPPSPLQPVSVPSADTAVAVGRRAGDNSSSSSAAIVQTVSPGLPSSTSTPARRPRSRSPLRRSPRSSPLPTLGDVVCPQGHFQQHPSL